MRGFFSHILFSITLAVINEAAQTRTPLQDALRSKRSFMTDAVHRRHPGLPGYQKQSKIANYSVHKRSGFDTLDLDALFEDPMFADMMAEEAKDDNHFSFDFPEFEPEPLYPLHQPEHLQPFHEATPINALHEPRPLHPQHPPRPLHPQHPPRPLHPPQKNDLSNVIPGALGPMDEQPRGGRMQEVSGQMLDEFLWFLELKESGLLDSCMAVKRR